MGDASLSLFPSWRHSAYSCGHLLQRVSGCLLLLLSPPSLPAGSIAPQPCLQSALRGRPAGLANMVAALRCVSCCAPHDICAHASFICKRELTLPYPNSPISIHHAKDMLTFLSQRILTACTSAPVLLACLLAPDLRVGEAGYMDAAAPAPSMHCPCMHACMVGGWMHCHPQCNAWPHSSVLHYPIITPTPAGLMLGQVLQRSLLEGSHTLAVLAPL